MCKTFLISGGTFSGSFPEKSRKIQEISREKKKTSDIWRINCRMGQFLKIKNNKKTINSNVVFFCCFPLLFLEHIFLISHQYYRDECSQKHVYSSVTTTVNREAS